MGNIFTDQNQPPVKAKSVARVQGPPKSSHVSIEIYNGSKRSEQKFPVPEAKQ
jgi:hypothetical protein